MRTHTTGNFVCLLLVCRLLVTFTSTSIVPATPNEEYPLRNKRRVRIQAAIEEFDIASYLFFTRLPMLHYTITNL